MEIISLLREIGTYFKKNIVVTIFFFITIIVGATNIFGLSNQPAYKCWVLSSFVFTLGYTLAFYRYGRKKGYFKILGGDKSVAIIVIHIPLVVITLLIANDYFDLFRITPGRFLTLILMLIFALTYSIINWNLHLSFKQESDSIVITRFEIHESVTEIDKIKLKITGCETQDELEALEAEIDKIKLKITGCETQNGLEALEAKITEIKSKNRFSGLSKDFRSAVFMSDLPLSIAFLVLTIYSIFIDYCIQMDYFFSGAIAFQMMASNAVWIFNDDKIFTKLEE